jgi:methionine synthase I (cobalamin-dependent)
VEAGSQVILTNTFGANRLRLAEGPHLDALAEINRAGVEISLRAAGDRAAVFASIGPSGKMLFAGETNCDALFAAFSEQASALAEAGAHGLVIETMSDLDEAKVAVEAARATGLPVVACMVFDSGKGLDRTLMGQTPEQVAEVLTAAGADVIGANCGQGVSGFVEICRRLHAATDRPIWIKANAGLPEVTPTGVQYRTTPEEFAGYAPQLVEAGATFLGGCCGTRPEFIRALNQTLGRS